MKHPPYTDAQELPGHTVYMHILFTVNRDMGKAMDAIVETPVHGELIFPAKKRNDILTESLIIILVSFRLEGVRSCDRQPGHRLSWSSLFHARAETVPKVPSCNCTLLMQSSLFKFIEINPLAIRSIKLCVISSFRRGANYIFALLRVHAT